MIDFPQMLSVNHQNAEFYFNRDVQCIRTFFKRKFDINCSTYPSMGDVARKYDLDIELEASGFTKQMMKDLNKVIIFVNLCLDNCSTNSGL